MDEADLLERLEGALAAVDARSTWTKASWAELTRRAGVVSLTDLVSRVRGVAPEVALTRARIRERSAVAVGRAAREWEDVERLLELRADVSLDARSANRDLGAERDVADHLIEALQDPVAHWSGACLVVLSNDELPR